MTGYEIALSAKNYKEIIKSAVIYRSNHSGVRAKDHNRMKVIHRNFSAWHIHKSGHYTKHGWEMDFYEITKNLDL